MNAGGHVCDATSKCGTRMTMPMALTYHLDYLLNFILISQKLPTYFATFDVNTGTAENSQCSTVLKEGK